MPTTKIYLSYSALFNDYSVHVEAKEGDCTILTSHWQLFRTYDEALVYVATLHDYLSKPQAQITVVDNERI